MRSTQAIRASVIYDSGPADAGTRSATLKQVGVRGRDEIQWQARKINGLPVDPMIPFHSSPSDHSQSFS
jgi:hypothetical protein